jgi:hypothetical protein
MGTVIARKKHGFDIIASSNKTVNQIQHIYYKNYFFLYHSVYEIHNNYT